MGNEKAKPPEEETKTVIQSLEYTLLQKKIDEQNQVIKSLKNENLHLRKVIENGEMSKVEDMINTFQREVKKSLRDISDEVNCTDFSSRTIDSVNSLIDFLSYISKELYSLVSISNEGYFAYSEELRQCEKLKEDLLAILSRSSFTTSIMPDDAEKMVKALREAISKISDCLKEDE